MTCPKEEFIAVCHQFPAFRGSVNSEILVGWFRDLVSGLESTKNAKKPCQVNGLAVV
ncbi:hypothetical protein I79_023335 [Cricetulus griseus]|uniref:Uncharacterized protein n=1 Tax=Cricetulus griseus TaxID=10029 RepID=G3IHN5_CRIGR|nr:hypothetical protein I79_023335 [Cricetulus griseus]